MIFAVHPLFSLKNFCSLPIHIYGNKKKGGETDEPESQRE